MQTVVRLRLKMIRSRLRWNAVSGKPSIAHGRSKKPSLFTSILTQKSSKMCAMRTELNTAGRIYGSPISHLADLTNDLWISKWRGERLCQGYTQIFQVLPDDRTACWSCCLCAICEWHRGNLYFENNSGNCANRFLNSHYFARVT